MNRNRFLKEKTANRVIFKPFLLALLLLFTVVICRAQPTISSFAPASGPVGTTVSITGTQFDPVAANNVVYFGAVRAVVTGATATMLTVKVPAGSTYQPITVSTHGLTACSSNAFGVTFSGVVNDLTTSSFSQPMKSIVGKTISDNIHADYAVADIDGDGKPDVVTGNAGTGLGLQVYRNTSAVDSITFAEQDFATGNVPVTLALGDLDGDGLVDVAIAGNHNGVSVLRNQSSGGAVAFAPFVIPAVFAAADSAIGVAIGDMDGDGKPDLILLHCISGASPILSVYRNTSAGGIFSFADGIDLVPGNLPQHILVRDLDGDGKPDIVIANTRDSTISVYQNTGVGSSLAFTKTNYKTGPGPIEVVAGDLNGDGKPDLAVANSGDYAGNNSATMSVFLNNSGGSLTFAPGTIYPTGVSPQGITIGDLDGDGLPDIVTGNIGQGYGSITVMQNTGSSFTAPVSYMASVFNADMVVCDLDGDGYPDILSQSYGSQTILRSLVNVPAGGLVPPVITAVAPMAAAAGSSITITGTHFDSVAANNIVYFGAVRAKVSGGSSNSLTVAVPKGASYAPPSVTTSHQLTAKANLPFDLTFPAAAGAPFSGGFLGPQMNVYPPTGTGNGIAVLADIDNDGKPDIVVADVNADSVFVFRNISSPGAPAFSGKIGFAVSVPTDVGAADVDGDGRLDLVAVGSVGLTVCLNQSMPGAVAFASPVVISFTPTSGMYLSKLAIGDLDRDGQPDLAVSVGGGFSVWKNRSVAGKVQFTLQHEYQTSQGGAQSTFYLALADFNGDGLPDIVATGNTFPAIVNNTSSGGDITFGNFPVYVTTGTPPAAIAVGDVDGDGLPDLAIPGTYTNTVSILRNTGGHGTIAFANAVNIPTTASPLVISFTDLNGDGLPDLAVTGADSVSLLKNTSSKGSIAFDTHADYSVGKPQGSGILTPSSLIAGDLDGDGLPDIGVTNLGTVSYFMNREQRPVITSCTPSSLQKGTSATIVGFNLSGATAVSFGGTPATSFTVVSSTEITAVASDGSTGALSVTTPYGVASLKGITFPGPTISGLSPTTGPVGSTVVITGTGFSATGAHDIVRFGSVQATVLNATNTSLTVRVPGGGSYQPVSVTVNRLTAWSGKSFDITFPDIGNRFTPLSFAPHVDSACGDSPQNLAMGDLDGDGKPDIVVPNYNGQAASILVNSSLNGMISLKSRIPVSVGQNSVGVNIADLDGDGKLDLVLAHGQNPVSFLLNTSTGGILSFGPEQSLSSQFGGGDYVAVGDIDGDGRADLVTGQNMTFGGPVYILHNTTSNGTVSFDINYTLNSLTLGNSLDGIATKDLDGDGRPEIILSYYSGNTVVILGNTSSGSTISFNQGITLNPGGSIWQVAFGDLDGDGKTDMAVTVDPLIGSRGITVYRNTSSRGALSFANQAYLATDGTPYEVAIGDLDGDGHPDIAAANSSVGLVSVFKNSTTGPSALSFGQKTDYATSFDTHAIAIGDVDGDGKPDLVTGDFVTGFVSLLRNQIGEPTITPSGANPVSGDIVNRLIIDSTVQTLNGSPYAQRHYDILPANNAATATATVTLYFTQQDFDAYNAAPNHGGDLPHGPNDAADKAHLRIYQYHGFSATGVPGTYSSVGLVIQPADSNIVWNASYQWWAVTFDVTGFSGFFVSSAGFSFNQTPAPVITANGPTHFCGSLTPVILQSSADTLNQWYKDGHLINGATARIFTAADSGVYTVATSNNGIISPQSASVAITVTPVPAKPVVSMSSGNLQSSAATGNQWYHNDSLLAGVTGQYYHPLDSGAYTVKVTIDSCTSPESDSYPYRPAAITDTTGKVRLVPNPTKGMVALVFPNNAAGVSYHAVIIDMEGRVLLDIGGVQNGGHLDLNGLAPGIYSCHVFSSDGRHVYTVRIEKL